MAGFDQEFFEQGGTHVDGTCILIRNCFDENEEYYITMQSGQPTIYVDSVYAFGNVPNLLNKCFHVVIREACETPNYEEVTLVTSYGTNCTPCLNTYKFESCNEPGTFIHVTLAQDTELATGYIYSLDIGTTCYTYIEFVTGVAADFTDVNVLISYDSTDCLVCVPVHHFIDCLTKDDIYVRFVSTENPRHIPDATDINYSYQLSGNVAVDHRCLLYKGTVPGTTSNIITDISFVGTYCYGCNGCYTLYKLINCLDSTDFMYIYWDLASAPLDITHTYIFDFEPDKCYIIQKPFCYCYRRS